MGMVVNALNISCNPADWEHGIPPEFPLANFPARIQRVFQKYWCPLGERSIRWVVVPRGLSAAQQREGVFYERDAFYEFAKRHTQRNGHWDGIVPPGWPAFAPPIQDVAPENSVEIYRAGQVTIDAAIRDLMEHPGDIPQPQVAAEDHDFEEFPEEERGEENLRRLARRAHIVAGMTDSQLRDTIQSRLPCNYQVTVEYLPNCVFGLNLANPRVPPAGIPARRITLDIPVTHSIGLIGTLFKCLIGHSNALSSYVWRQDPDEEGEFVAEERLERRSLAEAILGTEDQGRRRQLDVAYDQGYQLQLCISEDLQHVKLLNPSKSAAKRIYDFWTGDPRPFRRGGEEIELLEHDGPFEEGRPPSPPDEPPAPDLRATAPALMEEADEPPMKLVELQAQMLRLQQEISEMSPGPERDAKYKQYADLAMYEDVIEEL